MFVHKHQLQYLLKPEQYCSQEQYQIEMERMFLPGWHPVAPVSDLPKHGDFITLDLLGQPLQVRNFDGEYHTFLNVCAHRHCLLTCEPSGRSETLRCQYHGWEYDKTGKTGRIPDAGCFRPFDRENAQLHKFRTATCGNMIFVSLAEKGPSLRDYLGPMFDWYAHYFTNRWTEIWRWDHAFDCNWKLPIENTLESYHVPCLHQETLGDIYPSEEAQQHVLDERYTTVKYNFAEDEPKLARLQERIVKRLRGESTNLYYHHHVHPHIVLTSTDLYVHAQVYLPTSPTTSCTKIWYFSLRGTNNGPFARLIAKLVAWQGRRTNPKIQTEDAAVFGASQRGIEKTRHRGCIGTREERIYAFQRYVQAACDDEPKRYRPIEHMESVLASSN
jgi:phenylpropionate dioxygenase-like ring-hydroxylating dioxygenase large terminal subunit